MRCYASIPRPYCDLVSIAFTRGPLIQAATRRAGAILVLAAAYVLFGRLGLMLDAVGGFATLVWAPTGISIAALLLYGARLWPGVALGALVVNLWADAPFAVAAGIALGNTLEAVVATYGLRRVPGFRTAIDRVRDAVAFIVIGAALSTIISATVGVSSLVAGGIIPRGMIGVTWAAWWVGDAIGALVVAPLLLTWASPAHAPRFPYRTAELATLFVLLLFVAVIIFGGEGRGAAYAFLQPYMLAPLLIWAALRFDTRITTSAVFLIGAVAVWGTAIGRGPFESQILLERLRALQAFMTLLAPTLLVLAAVAAQTRRAEADLRRARDEADAASAAKSRFLAVMSHELRTPLTGILGYAELMRGNIGGQLSAQHREYVERLVWSASYLVSLIEGILTFSRAEAGRDEPRVEVTDIRTLVRETIAVVEPLALRRGLDVRLDAPNGSIEIETDAGKVRQIVLNLLGNAVKFSADSHIDVRVRSGADFVDVEVADHGVGIPPEDIGRIFEPFTQLDDASRGPHAGTGLGLSVSRTFARLLGGDISVDSTPGRGSTFRLHLPRRPPAAGNPVTQDT